jgi:hypothetical protein
MTISSINFQRVRGDKKQALDHIARTTEKEPVYLLEKSERKPNGFELLADVDKLHEEQMSLRKKNHSRGKAPELNDSLWEAVINLEEHHTMDDVKKVADFIHKKYHLTPTAIAIHRDEGYKDKTTGEVKYNYHAHVMFYTVDNGKSQMRTIGKKALSEMQTEVANLLHMERGQVNSKTVRLNHRQYREKAKELAEKDELYEKELYSLEQALDTAHDRDLDTQEELLTLKEQKAIVEAERKKYKEEADHIASEYRSLQALNKTLHTREELDTALAALRKDYEDRLAKKAELSDFIASEAVQLRADDVSKYNRTVESFKSNEKGLKAQKDYFDKAYNVELEVHQQLQKENKELRAELEKVTKERDAFVVIIQTVYQFLQTIFPTFDKNNPKQSMKNIYLAWKAQHQKSTETAQKRSQSDESTIERVEVQPTSQSQSMSKFEASQPKEKFYKINLNRQLYDMTAKDIHDWIEDYPEERDIIAKQLSEADRREVFGEPTQAPQKQSLFARVKHSLER